MHIFYKYKYRPISKIFEPIDGLGTSHWRFVHNQVGWFHRKALRYGSG